ncbi:amidase [Devosia sp. WQ 349]|uniref:amidase n=1 Tax=Devosia sp. WQ 349K1 TaxID=2800329 RepID=UPI001907B7F1|nr:amidase [Devosia sp. WQ 349K1]MBK1794440.1 amidase [Devosia sp. WQ 349K1]
MQNASTLADLLARPLPEIAAALAEGKVSSVDLTRGYLERIEVLGSQYDAYVFVTGEAALKQAASCDAAYRAGRILGVLHGVPIALKDLCETEFAPTSNGMAIHRNRQTQRDAAVVSQLLQAGAVVLGKLAMAEGACSTHHPLMPVPKNPWGGQFRVGSSSSGSGVAVAAALAAGAVGSDTGGSIRFPSAYCGLTGLKPSRGLVSVEGVCAMAPSLDHVGPMATTAEGCALMLKGMVGGSDEVPAASLEGLRLGYSAELLEGGLDAEVTSAYRRMLDAASTAGMVLVSCKLPNTPDIYEVWSRLCAREVALGHAETYPSKRDEYGSALAALAGQGAAITSEQHERDKTRQADIAATWQAFMSEMDCLALPIHAAVAPVLDNPLGAPNAGVDNPLRFTAPANVSGLPALALPVQVDRRGCPIGLQLMGPMHSDFALLNIGAELQRGVLPALLS